MPHPFFLPGGLNLFQFSVPYLAEKVIDLLYSILSRHIDDGNDEENKDNVSVDDLQKLMLAGANT
jgi:serine/threonine-protein phosphatase 2B catalytic subunit